jgi:hypothetical protein
MRQRIIKYLQLADVPRTVAKWQEFALTFDGYKHCGGLHACARIAKKKAPKTLNEFRTCLFFEQRRWHHDGRGPDEDDLVYIRWLLTGIRRILRAKPSNRNKSKP